MKKIIALPLTFSLLFGASASSLAAAARPFGLGIALIDPTGLSASYRYRNFNSFAAVIGWGARKSEVHIDHLWHRQIPFQLDQVALEPYVGLGLRLQEVDQKYTEDDTNIGLRVPVGLTYRWNQLEAFAELGPALNLIEDSFFVVDLTLGGRFYF